MLRPAFLIATVLVTGLALAQELESDQLPDPWKPGLGAPVPSSPSDMVFPEYNELTNDLVIRFINIRAWMTGSARKTKELRTDVDELQDQVEELQKAVAKLQQQQPQQPGGNKPAGADDARFKALEDRVAKLEAERGVFKAPFIVQGAGGKTVLRVQPDGYVLLGADGGNQIAMFTRAGEPASIALQSSNAAAVLSAGTEAKLTLTKPGAATTRLAAGGAELGLFVEKNGQLAAGLGAAAGKPVALRLYNKGGKVIAAAGENPRGAGTGFVYVGNGTRNGAALAAEDDGSGLIQVFAGDGTVAAGLVGKERLVGAYNASGAAVATLSKAGQSEGGNVTARNPAGEGVFSAGFNNAVGGGDACVYRAKRQNTFCIGIGALQ